jgi:hypothetical protein
MKMKILFCLILSIKLIECIKTSDYCYKKEELDCKETHNTNCGAKLCAKDQLSCQNLIKFSKEKNTHFFLNKFESFMNQIGDCQVELSNNKRNPKDVCLNAKKCNHNSLRNWARLRWVYIKSDECKCIGKHNFRCNSDYCALQKESCDSLKEISLLDINKCEHL